MKRRHRYFLQTMCLAVLVGISPAGAFGTGAAGTAADQSPVGPPAPARVQEGAGDPAPAAKGPSAPMRLTIQDAILAALENNRALTVERIGPDIQRTYEEQAQAQFDPVVDAQVSTGRERSDQNVRSGSGAEKRIYDTLAGNVAVEKFFPTGTTVSATGEVEWTDNSLYDDAWTVSRLGVSVTQALLRGGDIAANMATLRQARLDTDVSAYELRGFSESLLSQVESAYWDFALARRQIDIVRESLNLAELHQRETEEIINVGKLAESELVAARAEIALRRQELIEARSTLEVRRLSFLRLINPPGPHPFRRDVVLLSKPDTEAVRLDEVDRHVAVALRLRPDLNQARTGLMRDELEIVKTRNGLLPRMDFFVTLGKTGYADTFGGSASDIGDDGYDVQAGIRFEYPFKNRDASARRRRAGFTRDRAQRAIENLAQLIELDVRQAYIEVDRSRQQISASAETRKLDEEKLRIETEKFRVGRSTNFLVAQAQRDLLESRLLESRSVASYLKALTELFRLEGSLLERRGVRVPGREPPQAALRP